MIRPTHVKALDHYKIWIEFEDDIRGEIDLSHFEGKGVFKRWENSEFFNDVKVVFPYRAIQWGDTDEVELCTDTFYMQLTGKTWDELTSFVPEVAPVA